MNEEPYAVYVVVDPNFGEQLAALPAGVPVWIIDTPANKAVAVRLWKERPTPNHLTGITTYNVAKNASSEDNLINELEGIDLHHGRYSHTPPYTKIQVFGTSPSDRIRTALAKFGFDEFSSTANGFTATRPVPNLEK